MFIRDFIMCFLAAIITVFVLNWWTTPDYETCVKHNHQTLCYTVIK